MLIFFMPFLVVRLINKKLYFFSLVMLTFKIIRYNRYNVSDAQTFIRKIRLFCSSNMFVSQGSAERISIASRSEFLSGAKWMLGTGPLKPIFLLSFSFLFNYYFLLNLFHYTLIIRYIHIYLYIYTII